MPRSEQEAEQVRLIIRSLKSNMAVKTKAALVKVDHSFKNTQRI